MLAFLSPPDFLGLSSSLMWLLKMCAKKYYVFTQFQLYLYGHFLSSRFLVLFFVRSSCLITAHVPLFRKVFLRRMREIPTAYRRLLQPLQILRCFRAEYAEIPRVSRAELHEMQFLCIAKHVAANEVNSNRVCGLHVATRKQWRVFHCFPYLSFKILDSPAQ